MTNSYRMTLRVLYSAHYHRQHYTPQAFEQFGALYIMHNLDDQYQTRPVFEPLSIESQPERMRHQGPLW